MLALAGCAENDGIVAGCPNVGVLRDAGTLYAPEGTAILSSILANCAYDDTSVTVAANLVISGRAAEGGAATAIPVTYFVAVTDPNRNIISKTTFTATVPLSGATGEANESFTQVIPAPKTVDARWFEVLVGFQMDPAAVEANRKANEGK